MNGWAVAAHANDVGGVVSFVACPIYRDTDSGRKSGCWLADDPATQRRYDVSAAPMKPQLGKQVLVEGIVSDDPDACGGITLRPVRTSLLTTSCASVTIPAEGYSGRRFIVPGDVMKPTWEPRTLPSPPYVQTDFHIFFDLHNEFLVYQHSEIVLEKAVLYAQASRAREVRVIGFAATDPIRVSGEQFVEPLALAKARAQAVTLSLTRLGIAPDNIVTSWQGKPSPVHESAAPTAEASKRRVTIRVIPAH